MNLWGRVVERAKHGRSSVRSVSQGGGVRSEPAFGAQGNIGAWWSYVGRWGGSGAGGQGRSATDPHTETDYLPRQSNTGQRGVHLSGLRTEQVRSRLLYRKGHRPLSAR